MQFDSVLETIINNIKYSNHAVTSSHRENVAGLVKVHGVHSATAVVNAGAGRK